MKKKLFILVLLTLIYGLGHDIQAVAAGDKLDNDLRYLVGRYSKYGSFAVAVVDESSVRSAINASSAYPLASVFKLPLLVAIKAEQAKGKFPSMQEQLTVSISDQCIGSGSLAKEGVGAKVTVNRACRLMMGISDNTATDLLFRAYGTSKLDPELHSWGYRSSQIILTNRQAWLLSLGKVPSWPATTPQERIDLWDKLDRKQRLAKCQEIERGAKALSLTDFQRIEDSSKDSQSSAEDNKLASSLDNKMSALDLAKLLVDLDSGKLVGKIGRDNILDILAEQKFHSRLPRGLMPTTAIYHKTGSLSGIVNDAGLLFFPGREKGVAVVFLSQNITNEAAAERLAAEVAKVVEKAYTP